MSDSRPRHTIDLPAYRAIVVVDVKNSTGIASAQQPHIRALIPEVLEAAFDRSGLSEQWADAWFPSSTGDGYIVGIPPAKLPWLIDPFIDNLQKVLAETDPKLRAIDRAMRMRMRLSINVGPLPDDGGGKPMDDTHRLLDSEPVRAELNRSSPDVTFLSAIVSDRAYQDAVAGRYTGLPPEVFREVTATVKDFTGKAWVYTPERSYVGDAVREAPAGKKKSAGTSGERRSAPAVHNEFSGGTSHGPVIQAGGIGHIHGVPEGRDER